MSRVKQLSSSADTFVPKRSKRYLSDTVFLCKQCGKKLKASFENAFKNGWPRCHAEGMHIHESSADMSKVMTTVSFNGRKRKKKAE